MSLLEQRGGGGDQPRRHGDLVAEEPARISEPVMALVVMENRAGDLLEEIGQRVIDRVIDLGRDAGLVVGEPGLGEGHRRRPLI